MKYFQLAWRVPGDATIIYQQNLIDVSFWSGHSIAAQVTEPLRLELDTDFGLKMPTFYDTPAFIARKDFVASLMATGVSNVEVFPAQIEDVKRRRRIDDYVLLNVVGVVSCADLDRSDHNNLADDDDDEPMRVIDRLVIFADRVRGQHLFLVHEDPQFMVVSEVVQRSLAALGLDDVFLEELETA